MLLSFGLAMFFIGLCRLLPSVLTSIPLPIARNAGR